MAKKRRRGNLKVVGNLRPGLHGVMDKPIRTRLVFEADERVSSVLPIGYSVKPPHPYNRRPGFENAALPEMGSPESEWWNKPQYKGWIGFGSALGGDLDRG